MRANGTKTTGTGLAQNALRFPFSEPPAQGEVIEVAKGIMWARIPLPFQLDHVNVYLIKDEGGWAILDTGIAHDRTRAAWEALFAGPLAGWRITRIIVTHYHPDHIGLAGWLCERFKAPLLTSQTSYLGCMNISLDPGAFEAKHYFEFYRRHGMSRETAALVATQGHAYLSMVTPLPPTFRRLVAGDRLVLAGRSFEILTSDGHAPEQVLLYAPEDGLLFGADQVLEKISPNVSVWAVEPDGDPLGLYLRSLARIERDLPEDTLVLPGHRLPFYGLHQRCRELVAHHRERCDLIVNAVQERAQSVAELVPVLFKRELDPHQLSFAFSETHAHVNRMIESGALVWREEDEMLKAGVA